jgi:hypothetical protein
VIAAEIVEDLEAALAEFSELAESLQRIGVDIQVERADRQVRPSSQTENGGYARSRSS